MDYCEMSEAAGRIGPSLAPQNMRRSGTPAERRAALDGMQARVSEAASRPVESATMSAFDRFMSREHECIETIRAGLRLFFDRHEVSYTIQADSSAAAINAYTKGASLAESIRAGKDSARVAMRGGEK